MDTPRGMADNPPSHSEGLCGCGCEVLAKFWTVGLSVKIGGLSVSSAIEIMCKALVGFLRHSTLDVASYG